MIETFLVSYTHAHNSTESILLVGKKKHDQQVDIVNAFQGTEADELYKKLKYGKKEKNNE